MNPIETIERDIQQALPTVWTRLRRPRTHEGAWWLDAKKDDHTVTVQWVPRRGFGVTASALGDGYGEGPEETFERADDVIPRVVSLLRAKSHTVPPQAVMLRELRARMGVTQEDLAERLGVQQAAVSRLERREDITLSSLQRFVGGLDARLEINIRTANGESLPLSIPDVDKRHRMSCVHVTERLENSEPLEPAPTADACAAWLAELADVARSRWTLRCEHLDLQTNNAEELASSTPAQGIVSIDIDKASRLSCDIWALNKQHSLTSPDEILRQTFRHLLAHEIGHCVDQRAVAADPAFCGIDDDELRADAISGWIIGHAGSDPMIGAVLSSRLGCRDPNCDHPHPEARSHAYLTGHLHGSRARSCQASMDLLVLRSRDLDRSRSFYQALGLHMRAEQHDDGPLHYSVEVDGTTIELYPTKQPTGGIRLGLRVPTAGKVIEQLLASGLLAERPIVRREQGRNVSVVRDPDGNTIALEME